MGRKATRTEETSEVMMIYSNKKVKAAIKLMAAKNCTSIANYVHTILSEHPDIKKAMKIFQ